MMTPERLAAALRLREAGDSHTAIARVLGVGLSSVERALDKHDRAAQDEDRSRS